MWLIDKLFRRKKKLKMGIAFAGGGAKGVCHLGVIKALEEEGIKIDCIAGTSAGSIVGAALAAGKTFEELEKIASSIEAKDIRTSKVFFMPSKTMGVENLTKKAIGGDLNFSDLKTEFYCVATCLNDGKQKVFSSGNVAKAVSASCCFPGFFIPVEIDGKNYIDGGLLNNLPTNILQEKMCDIIIAVDLSASNEIGTNSIKTLDVLANSYKIISSVNVSYARQFADVIIKPDMRKFKATKLDDPNKLIEEGYLSAKEQMPKLKHLIKTKKPINRKKIFKLKKIEFKHHKKQIKQKEKFNIYAKEGKNKD